MIAARSLFTWSSRALDVLLPTANTAPVAREPVVGPVPGRLLYRYRPVYDAQTAMDWIEGELCLTLDRCPNAAMEVGSGEIVFLDGDRVGAGELLLGEFGVPGDRTHWRAVAYVTKVAPVDDVPHATQRVWARFEWLSPGADAALGRYVRSQLGSLQAA